MTDGAFTTVPLTPIRKVIAARMTEAQCTVPHFRLVAEIELDALMNLRKELRERDPGVRLSLNDLMIKACGSALMEVPAVNVQWAENGILMYRTADISVVTALAAGGLSTPIIRHVNSKSVWEISREVKELAARAAMNTLKVDEVLGGSFSISNLGMHDVDQFDAIINLPQCAILAVGSAKPRVVASSEGGVRIATVAHVTLSCDHRAINGTDGAAFLSSLRRRLERPVEIGAEEGSA